MAAGSGAVLTSFIINLVTAAICFAVFSYLRIQGWARRFFAPRSFAKDIELRPKPLADRFLAWVVPVLTYSEAHLIQECGLDAAMYLRVIRLGVYLFLPISLWTIIAVLPVNLTGGDIARILAEQATSNSTSAEQKYTDFDKYSLANVPKGSPRMWVHLVSVCAVVFYTLWVLHRFNHESVLLRLLFLANSKRGGPTHTVLVTDIPGIKEATAECAREHAAAEKEDKARRASEAKLLKAARSSSKTAAGKEQTDPELGAGGAPAVTDTASPSSGGSSGFEGPSTHATGTGFRSKSKYCMVDPGVDPRYAATGGRLDGPSMGPSRQEALQQLEAVSVDDVSLELDHDPQALTTTQTTDNDNTEAHNKDKDPNTAVVPALPTTASAVAGSALLDSPRHAAAAAAQRYPYDLTNKELDAQWQAKRALQDEGLTPQQLVAREFALVYSPRNVAAVNTVMDTSVLEPLVAEYDKIQQALEDYPDKAQLHMRLRKKMPHQQTTILVMLYGEWGAKRYGKKGFKKVDCLDHWTARLRFLKERILEEQRLAVQKAAPSAFVTLNTRTAQSVGSASLHFHDETVWRVQGAPAPFEVVWPNLGMTVAEKSSRNTIMWVLFWLMTLFFMIPVAAIQALIEVPKLAAIPILGDIVTAPVVRQLLEAVVPGLVLKIFLALVPTILTIMIKASGATSLNELDFGVVSRFFLFQVVVVFFGSVVAGSFFNQLKVWAEDPGSIVPTLGKSIPMTSTFFITFVLVNGLGVKSIAFLRAPGLVIYWLLSKFAGSPRAKERLWTYQYTTSGTTVVDHTLTILLGITFSCMNPIMSLAALAYFLVNTLGEGYNNIYVFRRQYESAGRLWRTVYNQVMAALYLMQLTMLGVLALKRFPLTVLLIIPILISIGCHVSTLRLLNRPWSITALHDAAALDATEAKERRVALLQQAKQERKSALRARKAAAAASASPAAAAAIDDTKEPLLPQGPAESLLLEALGDNPFVMSDQEKAAIAENYKSPCFKVDLDVLEGLEAQAADTRGRLDLLNAWAERRDAAEKEWKKKQGKGSCLGGRGKGKGEEALPFQFPEAPPPEVTIYDVGGEGVAMEQQAKAKD